MREDGTEEKEVGGGGEEGTREKRGMERRVKNE